MTETILIIGANSFSGQDFVDLVLNSPRYSHVIGTSRSQERTDLFLKYKRNPHRDKYSYVQCDMNTDMAQLCDLIEAKKPGYIVNFAAQSEVAPSWEHPADWFRTNTVALAELMKFLSGKRFLKRYLHVSSPEVYGTCVGDVYETSPVNPSTPYAASKAAADLLLGVYRKQYNFPVTWVRATNVYGARQQLFKIIPRSVIYLKLGKKIELHGGGHAVKSYIHIRDVSRGELAILEQGKDGEMYHLSPQQGVSVRSVVTTICGLLGKDFNDSVLSVEERPGQDAAYVINSDKARSELGWSPHIDLGSGLTEVVEWVNEFWSEIQQEPHAYQHKR